MARFFNGLLHSTANVQSHDSDLTRRVSQGNDRTVETARVAEPRKNDLERGAQLRFTGSRTSLR